MTLGAFQTNAFQFGAFQEFIPAVQPSGGGKWNWDWFDDEDRRRQKALDLRKAREEIGIIQPDVPVPAEENLEELVEEIVETPPVRRILSLKPKFRPDDERLIKSLDSAVARLRGYQDSEEAKERGKALVVENRKRRSVEIRDEAIRQAQAKIAAERERRARIEHDDEEIIALFAQLI